MPRTARLLNLHPTLQRLLFLILFVCPLGFYASCRGSNDGVGAGVIGSSGGTVTSDDGRVVLTIPPGALSALNTISITRISLDVLPAEFLDLIEVNTIYLLEPEGLAFAVPARITMEVGGTADDLPARVLLTRSNEGVALLQNQELALNMDSNQATLSADIDHFSEVWDNLPRDGGVGVRFSGIPSRAPVGRRVFTAKVTVGQNANSQIRSDGVIFSDNDSVPPIQPNDFERARSGLNIGALDANRAQILQGELDYDCRFEGVGEYRGIVSFARYDIEVLVVGLGFFVNLDNEVPFLPLGTDYRSKAMRTITCGSGGAEPVPMEPDVQPQPEPMPTQPDVQPQPEPMPTQPEPEVTEPETPTTPVCNEEERVCQDTGQAPTCVSQCMCDDGFPIGDCSTTCLDTQAPPTQCAAGGIGCADGLPTVCPG